MKRAVWYLVGLAVLLIAVLVPAALYGWDDTGSAVDEDTTITSYVVRLSTDSGAHWSTLGSVGSTAAQVNGLTNGVSYVFDIAATNSAGTGAFSAASNAVTPASSPGAPTQVIGAPGDGQVSVSWTAPSSNGGTAITGYQVEWSSDSGAHWSSPLSEPSEPAGSLPVADSSARVASPGSATRPGSGGGRSTARSSSPSVWTTLLVPTIAEAARAGAAVSPCGAVRRRFSSAMARRSSGSSMTRCASRFSGGNSRLSAS